MTTPLPPKKPFTGDPKQYSPDHFSKSISATCLCGSISVTINEDIFALPDIYLCHCANCRKVSGSYVAPNLRIAKEKVEIEDRKGTMKTYEDWETGSGNKVERTFCSGCGSPIKSESSFLPNLYILKMGMFPQIPKPKFETFADHRHEWQGVHEGVVQFATLKGGKKLGE